MITLIRWRRALCPALVVSMACIISACTSAPEAVRSGAAGQAGTALPDSNFSHPPELPHGPDDLLFSFRQLEHYYRVPGEFTYRLMGDQYGFDRLSFLITETHPGGGPGLHVHDVEEAHVLLDGTARYRIGDTTFTVNAPYVARVPAGVAHTFVNAGGEPFNLIAIFASNHPNTRRIGPNPLTPPGEH